MNLQVPLVRVRIMQQKILFTNVNIKISGALGLFFVTMIQKIYGA